MLMYGVLCHGGLSDAGVVWCGCCGCGWRWVGGMHCRSAAHTPPPAARPVLRGGARRETEREGGRGYYFFLWGDGEGVAGQGGV